MLCIREIRRTHLVRKRPAVVLIHCHPRTWTIQAPPTNHDITAKLLLTEFRRDPRLVTGNHGRHARQSIAHGGRTFGEGALYLGGGREGQIVRSGEE